MVGKNQLKNTDMDAEVLATGDMFDMFDALAEAGEESSPLHQDTIELLNGAEVSFCARARESQLQLSLSA